jgi:uncharacterized protein (DUF58 family)
MLSKELIKKIKHIHIRTSRRVNTMMAGQYKSVFRGSGIEFEEVREYSPGDEIKDIDWKVSARLGRPFIKRYREERELILMLLVDMSASGLFGSMTQSKRDIAAEVAAILSFNAVRNNDKVGVILFTDQVEKYIPPKKGAAHVWRVIKEIYAFSPQQRGTDLREALKFFGNVCRKRTVAFIISDFLATDFTHELKVTSCRHEMIGIILSDPGEFKLPPAGILELLDFETDQRVMIDCANHRMRQAYLTKQKCLYNDNRQLLSAAQIDCIELATNTDIAAALTRYFHLRERRVR